MGYKEIEELAFKLLDAIIDENGEVSIPGKDTENYWTVIGKTAYRLNFYITVDAKKAYDSDEWTSTQENNVQIKYRNGKVYTFYGFSGTKFGGSESYEEDDLKMICLDDQIEYPIYHSGNYSR